MTAKRLIAEDTIGDLSEIRYCGGNRGPLYHLADKVEVSRAEIERQKPGSWWYRRASGGGSLLDYLGCGATLGTWYMNGEAPVEIACIVDETPGIEVDQHASTICRCARSLSKVETHWGTFADPWVIQPQPRCGFVFVSSDGTLASWGYTDQLTMQTRAQPLPTPVPADPLPEGRRNGIEYILGCITRAEPVSRPLDPARCLTGQRINDTAVLAASEKRTLALLP